MNNWEAWGTASTLNISSTIFEGFVADWVSHDLDIDKEGFLNGLNTRDYDLAARKMWKYGCTRGVQGTPTFFGNGFQIDAGSWSSDDWSLFVLEYGKPEGH